MISFVSEPLNKDLSLAYRKCVEDNWMLNYFSFPELPHVLSKSVHNKIQEACTAIISILCEISDSTINESIELEGKPLLESLDIPNHCLYWLKRFYKPGAKVFWGRPDFHLSDGHPWLLESNLASAAGYQQQVAGLISYYAAHPQFFDDFENGDGRLLNPLNALARALARVVKPGELVLIPDILESDRHQTDGLCPYGGLVSWLNLNTEMRFCSTFIHKLRFQADGIYVDKQRVDHVFMSYYNPHVFHRFDEFLPFWDLSSRGKVNILDSMNEVLWSNKLLLAFISEFIDDLGLDAKHTAVWKSSVPWTRIIRPGKTTYQGELINLERFAKSEKNRLVIKKAQSAEGKMVFIGKDVPQASWDETIARSLKNGKWILQEFVPSESVNILVHDKQEFHNVEATQTVSPYVVGTEVVGYLSRYYHFGLPESDENSASVTRLEPIGTFAIVEDQEISGP